MVHPKEFIALCVGVKALTKILKGVQLNGGIRRFNNKIRKVCVEFKTREGVCVI